MAPKASIKTTSKDAVLHTTNAQLENGRTLFNVALPMPGITITKATSGAGNVRLSCNTHPWMRGWIVITSEAAAISGADGRFTIDNVPPGTYELRVWHEALKGAPDRDLRAAATPGVAAGPAPRRSNRAPEGRLLGSALVSPLGDLIEGQGSDAESLATRVAYMTRLSELIGQALGSGETRSVRARYADSELSLQPNPDGNVLGLLQDR